MRLALLVLAFAGGAESSAYAQRSGASIGPLLEKIRAEFARGGETAAEDLAGLYRLRTRRDQRGLLIPVILEPSQGLSARLLNTAWLPAIGIEVDAISNSYIRVLVPPSDLGLLEGRPQIRVARAPIPNIALEGLGNIVSESVDLTGATDMQNAGVTGAGVRVAVVDLGFIGLSNAIANGELQSDTVAVDLPGAHDNPIESGTVHGVGVAEHVADMAPGAQIFCLMVEDEVDLENAADYLRDNGIDAANHSVGWVNASYYDNTGPITSIINRSRDTDGVFWAVSAGNQADSHWRGPWFDPDADNKLDFIANDESMDLTSSSSTASIFLNWNQYGNSVTDLDLYIVDKNDLVVASSTGFQFGPQDPAEGVSFPYFSSRAPYKIEVDYWAGPKSNLDITIFSFRNDVEYAVPEASFLEPADAEGAFTVGAIYHGDYAQANPPPEPFSSWGPTTDGRQKPDIAAPDGTSSSTYGFQGSFGTSFSSPTTAGAAALLIHDDPNLAGDPIALADSLRSLAIDVTALPGAPGPDNVYGWGKLNLVSNTTPVAIDDAYATDEDTVLTVVAPGVLDNDSDDDGDPLSAALSSSPVNGNVTLNSDGSFTYTPDPNFHGIDPFTYTADDGFATSNVATVTITVNPVNDPPIAVDDATYAVDEDIALIVSAPGVLGNDSDVDGDSLTAALATGPSDGTLGLNSDGAFTYTPGPEFNGTDTFTYTANDGTLASNVATVTITVNAVNDTPTTSGIANVTDQEDALDRVIDLKTSFDDVEEGSAGLTYAVQANTNASIFDSTTIAGGVLTLDYAANAFGTSDLAIRATDSGTLFVESTFTVTVTSVNDTPVAIDDTYSIDEDNSLGVASPGVLGNDGDTDGDPLTAVLGAGPANGSSPSTGTAPSPILRTPTSTVATALHTPQTTVSRPRMWPPLRSRLIRSMTRPWRPTTPIPWTKVIPLASPHPASSITITM